MKVVENDICKNHINVLVSILFQMIVSGFVVYLKEKIEKCIVDILEVRKYGVSISKP